MAHAGLAQHVAASVALTGRMEMVASNRQHRGSALECLEKSGGGELAQACIAPLIYTPYAMARGIPE